MRPFYASVQKLCRSHLIRESIAMCKDLSQRTTDFRKATLKSHLQKRCSRDSSEILQKVQSGESIIFILYKDSLVQSIRFSNLH